MWQVQVSILFNWKISKVLLLLSNVQWLGATQSINLIKNYTVFQNDTLAIFYCYGSGAFVLWILNGTAYSLEHAQRGIRFISDSSTGTTTSSRLIIPSNPSINNNTVVMCRTADATFSNVLTSEPANLTIQGECCTLPWKYACTSTYWMCLHVRVC